MLVRCQKGNHMVQVPDDFVGAHFVCPTCQCSISLDRQGSIQATSPPPKSREPKNLEEQIYDGLPPLAVMMAARRKPGHAYDDDDPNQKFQMTEDDWKALAAFEAMLGAAGTVREAVMAIVFAMLVDVFMVGSALNGYPRHLNTPFFGVRILLGACITLLACVIVLLLGSVMLDRARSRGLVDFVPGVMSCAALLFASAMVFGIYQVFDHGVAWDIGVGSVLFNIGAIAVLILATRRVNGALQQIEPPEITNRIQEALKYLK